MCTISKVQRSGKSGHDPERGQDLVEFAIVLPVLLLLLFGIIEFGILVYDYNTISNAAREGARYGIIFPTTNGDGVCSAPGSDSILTAACHLTTGLAANDVQVQKDLACINAVSKRPCVRVSVQYTAPLLTGPIVQALGGSGSLTMSSTTTMDLEQ